MVAVTLSVALYLCITTLTALYLLAGTRLLEALAEDFINKYIGNRALRTLCRICAVLLVALIVPVIIIHRILRAFLNVLFK